MVWQNHTTQEGTFFTQARPQAVVYHLHSRISDASNRKRLAVATSPYFRGGLFHTIQLNTSRDMALSTIFGTFIDSEKPGGQEMLSQCTNAGGLLHWLLVSCSATIFFESDAGLLNRRMWERVHFCYEKLWYILLFHWSRELHFGCKSNSPFSKRGFPRTSNVPK